MVSSRFRPPTSSTEPTPGICCRAGLTTSSASLVSRSMGSGAEKASVATGAAPMSNFCTMGVWILARQLGERGLDPVADVLGGHVHLPLQVEADDDLGDVLDVDGAQRVEAGERVERLLQRLGDVSLDGLRVGAREDGRHRHDGELDLGHLVDADARVGHEAEDDEHQGEHPGEDRARDEGSDGVHLPPSAPMATTGSSGRERARVEDDERVGGEAAGHHHRARVQLRRPGRRAARPCLRRPRGRRRRSRRCARRRTAGRGRPCRRTRRSPRWPGCRGGPPALRSCPRRPAPRWCATAGSTTEPLTRTLAWNRWPEGVSTASMTCPGRTKPSIDSGTARRTSR